jgi:hypothetical protein
MVINFKELLIFYSLWGTNYLERAQCSYEVSKYNNAKFFKGKP